MERWVIGHAAPFIHYLLLGGGMDRGFKQIYVLYKNLKQSQ